MITCREFVAVLFAYICGELSQDHEERIQQHLDTCPRCVTYKETYQTTILLAQKLPDHPLPTPCEQRLRANLERELGGRLDAQGLA
jgi:anti-sigma factor RsiW